MESFEPTKVLVVIGDPGLAALAAKALTHTRLQVEVAVTEQSIVAALTTRHFDLVLVGGHVGKRGPLVLCDVVRIRQPSASILVLLHDDTDEGQLRDHASRQLPRVHYVDLRGVAPGVDQGVRLRGTALGLSGLEEDPATAESWPQLLAEGEPSGTADYAPGEAEPAQGPGETGADEPMDGAIEQPSADGAPLLAEAVTDDDLAFAARMVGRSRGIDFRSPVQPSPAPEGTDRATAKLRDRVRELERHLARMAHVYAGRGREFDGAAARIAEAQGARESLEHDLQRLKDHFAEEREQWRGQRAERDAQLEAQTRRADLLETRAGELGAEVARLRDELKSQEAGFAGMLKQAQDAFTQLRDQSAQALAFYERRVAEQDKQAQALTEEAARVREARDRDVATLEAASAQALAAARAGYEQEIGNLRAAYQQATDKLGQLTSELETSAQIAGELAAVRSSLEEQRTLADTLQTRVNALEGRLTAAQSALAEAAEHERAAMALVEQGHQQVLAEKEAVAAQLDARLTAAERELEARGASVLEREREVATLAAKLEGRERELGEVLRRADDHEKELGRLRKADGELRDELEKARERTLQKALDARLVAIEEHARLAAETSSRHGEFLAALDQRTAKQGTLVDRVLRIIEPPETGGGGYVTPVVAARRLVERMRPDETVAARIARRLREPGWAVGAAAVVVALLAAVVLFYSMRGSEEAVTSTAATPAIVKAGASAVVGDATTGKAGLEAGDGAHGAAAAEADGKAAGEKDGKTASSEAADAKAEAPEAKAGATAADSSGAATASAAEPRTDDPPTVLTPDERKQLRRKMFDAYKAKDWAETAAAGLRLRAGAKLDWEAQLSLAQALRFAGRNEEAIEMFNAFLADYPENRYAAEVKATLEKLTAK